MKVEPKKIIPLLVSLFAFFMLFQFRSLPMSQFWKGYRVLYVYSDDLGDGDVLTILEKNGCSSVVSSETQRIPIVSQLSPVQTQNPDSYLFRRSAFFMDKNHRASVFYVPDSQTTQLDRALRELSAFKSTKAGTDGKSSFPWLAPLICLAFFLILLFFSSERILFSIGTFFFILFAFCRPMFTVSAASSLYFFAFFLAHRLWGRKNSIKTVLNSPSVLLFALSPLLVLFLSSPLNGLFYILSILGSASAIYLYAQFEQKREGLYSFKPVYIRSARMIPVIGRLGIRLLGGLLIVLLLITLSFRLAGNVSSLSVSASMPSLPSPTSQADSSLTQISDFMAWAWSSLTFPYRKISDETEIIPHEGDVVSITDYQEVDGKINSVQTNAFVYNSEFRDSVLKAVDKLDYPALENMMLKQGKNARFGYAKKASAASSERFGMLLLLVFIAIPAAIGISYILGRKRYGLSI